MTVSKQYYATFQNNKLTQISNSPMCSNRQRSSALDPLVSVIGPLFACCHGLLRSHKFEAQQMILAAAFLVQLGLQGCVPHRVMMIKEEKLIQEGNIAVLPN